jgi:hypothetical protein
MEYNIRELQKIFSAAGYNQIQSTNLSKDTFSLLDFFSLIQSIANSAGINPDVSFLKLVFTDIL